jgi:hypothetical protein
VVLLKRWSLTNQLKCTKTQVGLHSQGLRQYLANAAARVRKTVRPPLLRTPERPCLCLPRRMQQSPAGNELHLTHLFLLGGHRDNDCLLSTQRPGVASAPNQSSIDSPTRSLDSHRDHHPRHWLPLSDLIAYSFQEPRETFMVPIPMRLARCLFCRLLPSSCSLLANIILPLGRTNLFSSKTMIECPRRSGRPSRQLWIGTNPQHSFLTGLRTMARIH